MSTPAHYELRLAEHLDEHWSAWFGDLTLTREADGTTTLRGVVTDQAELHGLLAKVRDLGTTLISVNATDAQTRGQANRTGKCSRPDPTPDITGSADGPSSSAALTPCRCSKGSSPACSPPRRCWRSSAFGTRSDSFPSCCSSRPGS